MWTARSLVLAALLLLKGGRARGQNAAPDDLVRRFETEPQNALLAEQIGVAYIRLNDLSQAVFYLRKAATLDPQRISARKNLGTVLWFTGQKQESINLFRALENVVPDDPVPHLYLALDAYGNKNLEAAALHFEKAGTLATANPETLPLVVETYLEAGHYQAAASILETQIAAGGGDPSAYRWLGNAYDHLKQPDKAMQAFREAIKLQPESDENYLALANFAIDHANPEYARKVLQQGLGEAPHSPKLLMEMGLAWAIQGDFQAARRWFTEANVGEPGWSLPLLALGITDLQTGDAATAAGEFERAKELAPQDFRSYYLHAVALRRAHGEEDLIARKIEVTDLERTIALNPQLAKARVALAEAEIANGSNQQAEAQLKAAIKAEPTEPSAFYRLGLLCRREGRKSEADQLLHTFEQLKSRAHAEENEFVLMLKTVN